MMWALKMMGTAYQIQAVTSKGFFCLFSPRRCQPGVALGFKEREGDDFGVLEEKIDGHWGRDERALNAFKGANGVGLIGHYALPVEDAREIAWRQRALSGYLGTPPPDAHLDKELKPERTFTDPWRHWVRVMHCENDPLVEHIRRHKHTSAAVQGADRDRKPDTIAYLLSGEPPDGLPWDVPVRVMTREELAEFLGLEGDEASKSQTINQGLEAYNAQ